MPQFPVADAGRLVGAGTGLEQHFALAFVVELDPALQHIDQLKLGLVPVGPRDEFAAGPRADDVGHGHAAGRLLDSQVAVVDEGTQAVRLELAAFRMTDAEFPILHPRLLHEFAANNKGAAAPLTDKRTPAISWPPPNWPLW